MSKKKTTEEFIQQASDLHIDKYDYSKTIYKTALDKVTITCPTHGDFIQKANGHLLGYGCPKCGIEKAHKNTTLTTKEFINRSKIVHNDTYSYDNTVYKQSSTKVSITCKIHGDFYQLPFSHLNGKGCAECGKIKSKKSQTSTTKAFIEKATKTHGTKYDYSNSTYTSCKDNIIVICKEHGQFSQIAGSHISGQGCPICAKANQGWSYSSWEEAGKSSTYFDSFKLYIIKCWNDSETFYKIGKTFSTVGRRFQDKSTLPYQWELIHQIEGDARTISELECNLHKLHKPYSYTPNLTFGGSTECFSSYIPQKEQTL